MSVAPASLHRRLGDAAPMGFRVLAAFSAVAVGAGLGRALVTTYLPVLLERIRDAPGLIGTVMLVNTVAGFAVPLAAGAWSDHLRAEGHTRTRPFILGGTLLAAGGMLAIAAGHATSYVTLALLAAVTYLGLNAVTTGHRALIPQTFAEEQRAAATAGEELAMLLGTLAGVVAGGALVEARPWAPFVLGAAVLPVLAIPTVRRMRGREAPARRVPEEHRTLRAYARAAARPGVRLVLGAQALWVLGYVGLPPFFILYAERVLDLRAGTAALLLAAFGLLTGVAMLAAGAVPPAHQRTALLAGALTMGAGMFAVSAGSSVAAVAPALLPVAAGFGVVTTLGFPVFSAFIPEGEEGAYSALYFSARSVASAIALPTAGWTIALTDSYRTLFVLGGVVTVAAAVPLLRLGGGPDRHPVAHEVAERVAGFAVVTVAALAGAQFVARTELQEADEALFRLLHGLGNTPQLLDDLIVDPHVRNYVLMVALAGVAAAVARGRERPLRAMLLVAGAGVVAYAGVRACWTLWERPRPEEMLGTAPPNGHAWSAYPSFPSGHMAVTTALAAATAALVPQLRVVLWSYAALIGWTRLSYGAHFPTDVVAGLALGWAAALVTVRPLGVPLVPHPRPPTRLQLREAGEAGAAVALVAFAVLYLAAGAPASAEGGLLEADLARTIQGALIGLAGVWVVASWRHPGFAIGLTLTGAILGVFAAVQFTPGFAALAFAAFAVPALLLLASWPRLPLAVTGALVAAVAVAGAAGAIAAHDRVYGPVAPESATASPPDGPVLWAWSGAVTADGATVSARMRDDGRVRLLVGRDADLRSARAAGAARARPGSNRLVRFRVGGLAPDTTYAYGLELDGRLDRGRIGTFRTAPAGRASFTFAVGSCARVGSNASVYDAIRAQRPRFIVEDGDLFYSNIDDDAPARFLDAYDRTLTEPAPAAMFRRVPLVYTWDDHDFGGDGADSTADSRPAAHATYDAVVPHYRLAGARDRAVYQAFTYGRVRFLVLDTRSQRSPASTPDGPAKTMLGARQKAWLKRELVAARDTAALTVVVGSVPWIAEPEAGLDSWGGYAAERAELSRFVAARGIRNVLMISGDAHMVAIDDGSHSDYSGTGRARFPVFHAAALDRPGGVKGGPYSEGTFPGGGQFGTVAVDDRGDRVDVVLTGRRHDGSPLVRYRFSRPVGER